MKKIEFSKELILDCAFLLAGTFLYALATHCFMAPHDIAPGGLTGVATMLNYLFDVNIGLMVLLMNIPILLLAWKFIGKSFCIKTLISILLFTIFTDYVTPFIPIYTGGEQARMLAALFGGILNGAGLGLVFSRGFTTGGTDVISSLIRLKLPFMSTGKMLFFVDLVVVSASVLVYGNIESAFFALISMFVTTKAIDSIVYGGDKGKMVMIISDKSEEVVKHILESLGRGATFLKASGAYKKDDKNVIMTAVRTSQFFKLKKLVKSVDPAAFMIVSEASEIAGEGFKKLND